MTMQQPVQYNSDMQEFVKKFRLQIRDVMQREDAEWWVDATIMPVVGSNALLYEVLLEETAPRFAEFDLYIEGGSVQKSKAPIDAYSKFINNLRLTAKHVGEDIASSSTLPRGQVVISSRNIDAIEGPVRVVLESRHSLKPEGEQSEESESTKDGAPDNEPVEEPTGDLLSNEIVRSDNADSKALRLIAKTFAMASAPNEGDTDDDYMMGMLVNMSEHSRKRLADVANVVRDNGWNVHGIVRQRHYGVDPIELSADGAARISTLVKGWQEPRTKPVEVEWIVKPNGFKPSLGTAWVINPEGKSVSLQYADSLEIEVGEANSAAIANNSLYKVRVKEVYRVEEGVHDRLIRRELLSIVMQDEQMKIDAILGGSA